MVLDATLWPSRALDEIVFNHAKSIVPIWTEIVRFNNSSPQQLVCFKGSCACVSGHLLIDEAVQLCSAVSSGNPNTLCFACLPQVHSSTSMGTVTKNRRLLEDKLLARLDGN